MALIVETGAGLADAESYLAVADATTYFTLTDTRDAARDALIAAWTASTTGEKEAALREATRYLDGKYLERWVGYKSSQTQALGWPRSGGVDAYGFSVPAATVPAALKNATAEAALRALSASVAPDIAANTGALTSKSVSAGSVSMSQSWASGTTSARAKLDQVDHLLRPLLTGSGVGVVSLARA